MSRARSPREIRHPSAELFAASWGARDRSQTSNATCPAHSCAPPLSSKALGDELRDDIGDEREKKEQRSQDEQHYVVRAAMLNLAHLLCDRRRDRASAPA